MTCVRFRESPTPAVPGGRNRPPGKENRRQTAEFDGEFREGAMRLEGYREGWTVLYDLTYLKSG